MPELREYPDGPALVVDLAGRVAASLAEQLQVQATTSLVVSGGRSPIPLLEALARQPLAWERVTVTLADERWVPPAHPDSNEGLVRTHLLQGPAAQARFLPFWTGAAAPEGAAAPVAGALSALPLPFGTVLLGMGLDGHFASLFPGAAALAEGLRTERLTVAVRPPARAPHPRLSLSLRALLQSREILLVLGGAAKRAVLERALGEGPEADLPIRAILRQTVVPVSVCWAP